MNTLKFDENIFNSSNFETERDQADSKFNEVMLFKV